MKKGIYFLTAIILLVSCATRKKQNNSTFLKGFFAYYNTLFNSKEALQTELKSRDKSHKDNFYAPYIPLLTYEEQPLGTNLGSSSTSFSQNNNSIYGDDPSPNSNSGQFNDPSQKKGTTTLEIAELKAQKAISKYSVLKKGEEKNKEIFDAHILLTQSLLYQDKYLEALDALNYIFTNMRRDKRLPLAKIYQAQIYAKMEDYYKSNEIFLALKDQKLKKKYKKLLSVYYSEMLLKSDKKEESVEELAQAYKLNKDRKLRSRIAFLRGQILANLGKNEEARESFVTAYKKANNFEFEVKSQIEIAKTFNGGDSDYEGAKQYIEKISKKGTYGSRKNEFYYALGLMANKAGKNEEAKEFFTKSIKEKLSDPQIRGLSYYEIGKMYFEKDDYLSAGAYYDSALASMNYEPSKILLQEQATNIKQVSKNYYLIKKNDSILALTKMSEADKIAYFNKVIDKIKEKENLALVQQKKDEHSKGFVTGDYNANSIFANNSGGSTFQDFGNLGNKGFYFSNQSTIARGTTEFKRIWGERQLGDNWRTTNKTASIGDLKSEAMGISSAPNPRRLEPSFYIEKIPTDLKQISALKKDRDTASLGLGRMFENFFGNTKLATKTLYDLVDAQPENDVKLQALYQVFAMNYEKNPSAAERAKQMILSEFPYTSYAEYVKNPKNNSFTEASPEVTKAYSDAFDLYKQDKFEESKKLIDESLSKYPKDVLVPKFVLLNAFNTGKTAGKEVMILQLEQIALNYAKTPEGIKAKEMLKFLKSDLKVEETDKEGNRVGAQTSQDNQSNVAPSNENVDRQNPDPVRRNRDEMMAPDPVQKFYKDEKKDEKPVKDK